jgi:hypothetical protein
VKDVQQAINDGTHRKKIKKDLFERPNVSTTINWSTWQKIERGQVI